MLRRLKQFWKLSLLALLIPISVVIGRQVSLSGIQTLKAEYDHLYGFMPIPTQLLDESSARREALEGSLRELSQPDLPLERRLLLVQQIRENDEAMAPRRAADLSNTRAQAAIEQMDSLFLETGLLLSLAGIGGAWVLSRLLSRPLERLAQLVPEVCGAAETLADASSQVSALSRELSQSATIQSLHIADISPGIVSALVSSTTQTLEHCGQLEQMTLQGAQDTERSSQPQPSILKATELFQQVVQASHLHATGMSQLSSEIAQLGSQAHFTAKVSVDLAAQAEEMASCAQKLQRLATHLGAEQGASPASLQDSMPPA